MLTQIRFEASYGRGTGGGEGQVWLLCDPRALAVRSRMGITSTMNSKRPKYGLVVHWRVALESIFQHSTLQCMEIN